jgi:serine/threonine-protein kinase RsbW
MTESQNVRLGLTARPENVALIREVLAGLDDAVDLGATVEDIKAAVSEAANNVVMHAYGGEDGPMDVEISLDRGELAVVVRDYGAGIGPRALSDPPPGRGIGLVVIGALAASWEMRAHALRGVEVAMRFPIPAQIALRADTVEPPDEVLAGDSELELTIAPASLSSAILNRFVTGAAARAGFSIDRVSDAQLVVDALAAAFATSLLGDRLHLGVDIGPRRLLLRLGPLRAGGSAAIVDGSAVAELGPIIERLVDDSSSERDGASEFLTLVMVDGRGGLHANGSAG